VLRFKKLVMENFGPYKGIEILDFPIDGGVVIVRGRNGRGKTSILSALRFVLFGYIKLNGKKTIPLIDYVNQIGADDGIYSYKVSLDVEMDGEDYEITRIYAPKSGITRPMSERDYSSPQLSIRNILTGEVLTPPSSIQFLNQIMTESVSRFYLFDGELLKEYESELSESEDEGATQIREGIEKILGVPILKNTKYHLDHCYHTQESAYRQVLAADKTTEDLGNARGMAEKRRDEFQKDIDALTKDFQEIEDELREKQSLFDKFANDKELFNEQTKCENALNQLTDRLKQNEETHKSELKNAWKGLLVPILLQHLTKIDLEINNTESKLTETQSREKVIRELQKSIDSNRCEFCKQPLDSESYQKLSALLLEKQNEVTGEMGEIDAERLQHLKNQSSYIKSINTDGNVRSMITSIHKLTSEITSLNKSIILAKINLSEANDKVRASSISSKELMQISMDIATLKSKKDKTKKGLDDAKIELDNKIKILKNIDEKLEEITKSGDSKVAQRRLKFLENFKNLVNTSISCYQEELRKQVQDDATKLFLQLSSEKEYAGLKINENYGLDILRDGENKIPLRSSGYEHLVAFSLIGALHMNAPMRGPLFMDTSFGRLDYNNSENLIRILPDLSKQVIILVHDREIDEEMVHRLIPSAIKARYGIERISARESHLRLEGGK